MSCRDDDPGMKGTNNFLVLFNPSAGGGKALKKKALLEKSLEADAINYEMAETASEAHLRQLVRQAAKAGRPVIAAGGDSTFHIVANELRRAGSDGPLGLVGIGSSNDITREFGLATLERACRALKEGRTRAIDLGRIESEGEVLAYFIGQANIGLGVEVNRTVAALAEKGSPWARRQTLAGLLGILKAYRSRRIPRPLTIETEQGRSDANFVLAVFGNIRYWATGKMICPQALPDDGLLDACLFRDCSFRRLARLNSLAGRGLHAGAPEVEMLRSRSFEVGSDSPFEVQTDGDILKDSKGQTMFHRIRFSVLPAALKIFC